MTRNTFLARLKSLLRITEDERLYDSIGLVDQGVDSLVAIDMRAWFLKELGVDLPTLKILGGGSNADLIKAALEKIPELLGEASPKGIEGSRAPQPSAPVAQIVSPANDASSSSFESRYPDCKPALHSRGRGNNTTRLQMYACSFSLYDRAVLPPLLYVF